MRYYIFFWLCLGFFQGENLYKYTYSYFTLRRKQASFPFLFQMFKSDLYTKSALRRNEKSSPLWCALDGRLARISKKILKNIIRLLIPE